MRRYRVSEDDNRFYVCDTSGVPLTDGLLTRGDAEKARAEILKALRYQLAHALNAELGQEVAR